MLEVMYRDRDNSIDLLLKVNTLADPILRVFDMTDVTRMMLQREDGFTIDSVKSASVFDWLTLATSGIVSIKLGLVDLTTGEAQWRLIVFDSTNVNGINWDDDFTINVKKEYANI